MGAESVPAAVIRVTSLESSDWDHELLGRGGERWLEVNLGSFHTTIFPRANVFVSPLEKIGMSEKRDCSDERLLGDKLGCGSWTSQGR